MQSDLLQDNDVAIPIQYWTIDNKDINIHNEYQILSENLDIIKKEILRISGLTH